VKKANKQSGRSPAKSTKLLSVAKAPPLIDEATLLSDLRTLIQSARQRIATVAHSTQALLCWHLGRRLLNENLQGGRAAYGKQILVTLSQQLSWSHFHALLPIKDSLAREFYVEMCRVEQWDVRTLRQKIGGMFSARCQIHPRQRVPHRAEAVCGVQGVGPALACQLPGLEKGGLKA